MDKEIKKKCDSFYKEAFLNRKGYINQLEQELSKYKEANKKAIEYISNTTLAPPNLNNYINNLLEILKEVENE